MAHKDSMASGHYASMPPMMEKAKKKVKKKPAKKSKKGRMRY